MPDMRLGIDVGGTFVDFVLLEEQSGRTRIEKVHAAGPLQERCFEGFERLDLELRDLAMLIHGSTLVINTIVQESGARVGLITTSGFRDVLELGRGNRADIYDLFYKPPPPLVPRQRRHEVGERMSHRGEVLEPLDEEGAAATLALLSDQQVEGVAICFLHAYANSTHEQRMAEIVRAAMPNVTVSVSSDLVREHREFERTSTTVLNAYVQPRMGAYLSSLDRGLRQRHYQGPFTIMQSSGGMTFVDGAMKAPIRTVQSGPAGGVIAATALGAELGYAKLVSADVGGTTFDVALVVDGKPLEKGETTIGRRPVLQPTIDIVSIGAGGGSIAWIDGEEGLQVGPRSAEAHPGPACFGLGGEEPTVTDAQVVLGYLDPDFYLGSRMELDPAAARNAIESHIAGPLNMELSAAASGIIQLTNMNMTHAIRRITIERGHDPREFSLLCHGGGGGLFAGALMRELELQRAIIPVDPATFSAWGLLTAAYREDSVRTLVRSLDELAGGELADLLADLTGDALGKLRAGGIETEEARLHHYGDMRYSGQEHTVRVLILEEDLAEGDLVALRGRFDALHEQAYAHALPDHAVELVNLRALAELPTLSPRIGALSEREGPLEPKGLRQIWLASADSPLDCPLDCPIYDRHRLGPGDRLPGPTIVEEWTSTTLVGSDQQLDVDAYGNLIVSMR